MARKRTKKEALERLEAAYDTTSQLPKGGRRGSLAHEFAYLGAAGLIMLDPLNRLADERIVLPLDMVCIPAYQAYMIQGSPFCKFMFEPVKLSSQQVVMSKM